MIEFSQMAAELTVVDAGMGMAAALVAKHFAECGACVHRLEPVGGDPFDHVYPAHRRWRAQCMRDGYAHRDALLEVADVLIVGGEDYPGLDPKLDSTTLAERYPRLVIVRIDGYAAGPSRAHPAVDLLVQARTGLVWEQLEDRPIAFSMPLPTYGAAMLAMIAAWAALIERLDSGRGQTVTTSMQHGVGLFWTPLWMKAERPDAEFHKVSPKGVPHLIFQCADDGWIHFAMGVPGAVAKLYRVLGIDVPVDPNDRGNPTPGAPKDKYFGDIKLIAPYVRKRRRDELLAAAWAEGIAAEPVLAPGEGWRDAQVLHNGTLRRDATGVQAVGAFARVDTAAARQAPQQRAVAARRGPLAGLRILDMGSFVAGPYASKILAVLGADVIKVEGLQGSPGRGIVRHTIAVEANKRSLAVDMKHPEGARVVARLCARANAVHHNFRVGVAERLRIDPTRLREVRPDIVTLTTTAYGDSGPKAQYPGFDMVMQALCGHEERAGGEGNPPLWIRVPLVDYATGALGAVATLMGLYAQRRHGASAATHVSLLDTALFLMSELIRTARGEFAGALPLDAGRTGFHPAESLYRASDGWIAIAARDDAMCQRLARVLGLEVAPARAHWNARTRDALASCIAGWRRAALLYALERAEVWAEPCIEDGWAALQCDAYAYTQGLLTDCADSRYGRVTGVLGPLMHFSRTPAETAANNSAPGVGEHTRALLEEIGYSSAEIDALVAQRAVI
ncbi:CoA transferase [Burkholderia seminalis]|uniref:CoA transferase n=2 Tax=Burkholderia cepacia complex TaxID=87882 RepID=A0A8A8DFE2_9BURK|nr:CoA transferase [Burkholderia seminalis]QTO23332.1 CoA transferase [Burkholderia seminalis]